MNSFFPHRYQINLDPGEGWHLSKLPSPQVQNETILQHIYSWYTALVQNFKPEASTSFQARQTSTQFTSSPCLCQERTQYRHTVRQSKHRALVLWTYAATVSNRDDSATRQRKSRSAEAPKMLEHHSAHTSHTITWCLVK